MYSFLLLPPPTTLPVLALHTHSLLGTDSRSVMAPEVKFTSFGIPYVVEFGNIAFRTGSRSGSPSLSLNHSYGTYGSTSTLLATVGTASSETLHSTDEGIADGEGLYIQFASHRFRPPHKLSNSRLLRLKHRIAKAVLAAGMDSSPSTEKDDPIMVPTLSRVSYGSIQSTDPLPGDETGSLFRGTYGQVMSALQSVGLITTPCKESGVDEGTSCRPICFGRIYIDVALLRQQLLGWEPSSSPIMQKMVLWNSTS